MKTCIKCATKFERDRGVLDIEFDERKGGTAFRSISNKCSAKDLCENCLMSVSEEIKTEEAYRRGVDQALGMFSQFVHDGAFERFDNIRPEIVIARAANIAHDMRFKGEPHDWYMHKLLDLLIEGLEEENQQLQVKQKN
jgi:hypothetical protein